MFANLDRVKAQQQIFDGNTEGLDHAGIYNVYLVAYGNEALAERARAIWLENYVRQECSKASR